MSDVYMWKCGRVPTHYDNDNNVDDNNIINVISMNIININNNNDDNTNDNTVCVYVYVYIYIYI